MGALKDEKKLEVDRYLKKFLQANNIKNCDF